MSHLMLVHRPHRATKIFVKAPLVSRLGMRRDSAAARDNAQRSVLSAPIVSARIEGMTKRSSTARYRRRLATPRR